MRSTLKPQVDLRSSATLAVMKIGEAARRVGVAIHVLRHWDTEGVGRRRKPSAAGTAPASKTSNKAPATSTKRDPAQTRAIRQWAADEGYEISERGRIPADIEEAYNAAH